MHQLAVCPLMDSVAFPVLHLQGKWSHRMDGLRGGGSLFRVLSLLLDTCLSPHICTHDNTHNPLGFLFLNFFFQTRSFYVDQIGLELPTVPLPQPYECWLGLKG